MASRGLRDLGDGVEKIADDRVARAMKKRALRVYAEAIGSAAALTALAMLI